MDAAVLGDRLLPEVTQLGPGSLFQNNRKGVPQAYARARASSATICSVQVLSVFLCIFYVKKGNLIRIKTGLETYLIRFQTRTPLSRYPPYDCSNFVALPALRELESAYRVSILWDAVTVPTVRFSKLLRGCRGRSAAVCDPNTPRPFARCRPFFQMLSGFPKRWLGSLDMGGKGRKRVVKAKAGRRLPRKGGRTDLEFPSIRNFKVFLGGG